MQFIYLPQTSKVNHFLVNGNYNKELVNLYFITGKDFFEDIITRFKEDYPETYKETEVRLINADCYDTETSCFWLLQFEAHDFYIETLNELLNAINDAWDMNGIDSTIDITSIQHLERKSNEDYINRSTKSIITIGIRCSH